MEEQNRTWRGDGYGQRTVDRFHVLANCHIDLSGVVAWHVLVSKDDEMAKPVEFWVEGGSFRELLGAPYSPLDGGPNHFVIKDIVHSDHDQRGAVLEALRLLNAARLSPDRLS